MEGGEGGAAAPASQARKQGVSCDACKFRKVKCDRRAKLEKKREEESEDSIACSLCVGHGLRCTFTQNANPKRGTRNGRRIVAYQQGQGSASDGSPKVEPQVTRPNSNSPASGSDEPYSATTSRGLFDVEGLTQPLLDACFQAFLKYFAPCVLYLSSEVLAARYKDFFLTLRLNNGLIEPFWKTSPYESAFEDRPLSEILILAVGCLGASLLEPPVAEAGSSAKFRLQDKFALKFQERLEGDLARRLKHEGTDIVEACYIMADPYLSVIGNTHGVDPMEDPFRIRPATPEGMTRLLSRLGMMRRPKLRSDCPPGDLRIWRTNGGQCITEREMFRQERIFWTVFFQNAFRSMGDKTNSLIASDDFDWDVPRFVPRPGGSYDSLIFCERERSRDAERKDIVCLQANHFVDFDVIQFQVMLRLAFVIRTVSTKLASVRSQGRSVLVSDVERAVGALSAWYQQLPAKVTWEEQIDILRKGQQNNNSSQNEAALSNALKAFFVETLFHANVWNVWNSIETFGTRTDLDLTETASLMADTLRIADGSSSSSLSVVSSPAETSRSSDQGQQQRRQSETGLLQSKLDNLIARSFVRISKISKEAAQLNLVRASRLVFAHIFRMYAQWGCKLATKIGNGSSSSSNVLPINLPPGSSEIDYIFQCVDDLVFALAAVDSCEQARGMSFGLKAEVQACKADLQAKRTSVSQCQSPFDNGGSAPSQLTTSPGGSKSGSPAAINFEALTADILPAQERPADFDLNSLAPADVEWLQQYLQEQQQHHEVPQSQEEAMDFDDDDFVQAAIMNGTTTHLELSSPANQTDSAFLNIFPGNEDIGSTVDYNQADTDQLSQFLAFSDAQIWADTQWHLPSKAPII